MSENFPADWRFLILQTEQTLHDNFYGNFLFLNDTEQLTRELDKHRSFNIVIVCPESEIMFIGSLLSSNMQIKFVYIQTNSKDIFLPVEFLRENFKHVLIDFGEKQLMCHLYLRAMCCYFEQGKIYKENKNIGLANRCFLDAKHALEKVEKLSV